MVDLLTALIIQGNETDTAFYQDEASQKWGFEVFRMERDNYRPLITCQPFYDTEAIAREEAGKLVAEIRALDLSPQRKGLGDLLGDSKEIVQAVIDEAQKPL